MGRTFLSTNELGKQVRRQARPTTQTETTTQDRLSLEAITNTAICETRELLDDPTAYKDMDPDTDEPVLDLKYTHEELLRMGALRVIHFNVYTTEQLENLLAQFIADRITWDQI
jgi:hypothetical protein